MMVSHADRAVSVGAHDRIEVNSRVMLGNPVINGTRVTVELILRKLAEGASEIALIDEYPQLSADDIRAALRFAADTVALEEVFTTRSVS